MRALNLHPWIKASINFSCKKYLEKILNSYFLCLIISVLVREKRRLSNCEANLTFTLFEDMFAFDYHAFFKKFSYCFCLGPHRVNIALLAISVLQCLIIIADGLITALVKRIISKCLSLFCSTLLTFYLFCFKTF